MKSCIGVLALGLCLLGASDCAYAKVFREVEIIGLSSIEKNDLKAMLTPYVGKEFDPDQRAQLEKDFSKISMFASVSFKLMHQDILRLIVQERKPVASTIFQKVRFVDDQGVVFDWFGSSKPPTVPIVYGDWKTKTEMHAQMEAFLDAVRLLREIEQVLLAKPVSLYWNQTLGWSFVWKKQLPDIYIGPNDFTRKLTRLSQVIEDIMSQKDKILRVDCNFRDRIVVKLRPAVDA